MKRLLAQLSGLWSWTPDVIALAKRLRFYLGGAYVVAMLMLCATKVPFHLRNVHYMAEMAAEGWPELEILGK